MIVAALVVALAVDATNFVTACASSAQAFKTATLLKTLNVNALISGEIGVSKKSLARYILPNAAMIEASNFDELLSNLDSANEIIIVDLENSPNIKSLFEAIESHSIRVVATVKSSFLSEYIDEIFSVKFDIPPLCQRSEDVKELIKKFTDEASLLFSTNI